MKYTLVDLDEVSIIDIITLGGLFTYNIHNVNNVYMLHIYLDLDLEFTHNRN